MKIGVGIITCNRFSMLLKLVDSLPVDRIDEAVIVNDGEIAVRINEWKHHMIHSGALESKGVAAAKNEAIKYLYGKGCDYIFIIEDDMLIINENIFDEYIKASKQTGLQHLMFGYHGPANKAGISHGKPVPRAVIEYPSGQKIALCRHCVGAFCMYTREVIAHVGLMDVTLKNAWEHIDHSLKIVNSGYIPGYWYWPDIENSLDFVNEQACSEESSSIRGNRDWMKNINTGAAIFKDRHGCYPTQVLDQPIAAIKQSLATIYKKYSSNV